MKRQKNKFLNFCFACAPGAGQMYLGFLKQGVSIMSLFCGCAAICALFNIDAILFALPVIWAYGFFDALNKNSLPPEQFEQLEDKFLIFTYLESVKIDFRKWRIGIAVVLIFLGLNGLYSEFISFLRYLDISFMDGTVIYICEYIIPKTIFSVIVILAGAYLIRGKKKSLSDESMLEDKE